jgi:MYND finger
MRCKSCRAAHYCSNGCQKRDWALHKTVCKPFNCLPLRPAPSYKLAFLFPVESSKPELVYVDCRRKWDEEDGQSFEMPEMSSLLGNDKPDVGRTAVTAHGGVMMDHTICIHFRDAFLKDGSTQNKSIIACTRGAVVHTWNGPFVVMTQPTTNIDPGVFEDVTLGDLRSAVDYFSRYRDESVEDLEAFHDMTEPIVKGVRISCDSDRRISGADEYTPIGVRADHIMFFAGDRPRMPELMQIPILVYLIEPDRLQEVEAWAEDDTRPSYATTSVTFLFLDANPKSTSWGWAPFKWQENFGTVIVVREDRKKITPRQVEALCCYCHYKMQPLFQDSYGGGLVERTKAEVLSHLTKAKFADFFEEHRANKLDDDPLWAEEKSPYEE